MAEITRSETSERARLLRVDSSAVTLDRTGGPDVFGSVSVITFDRAEPGAIRYAGIRTHLFPPGHTTAAVSSFSRTRSPAWPHCLTSHGIWIAVTYQPVSRY